MIVADKPNFEAGPGALRGYALCAEPRAGTTFLKEALRSTVAMGEPVEWFAPQWEEEVGASGSDFLRAMLSRTASSNGIYGLKIFSSHARSAERHGWATRLPNLSFVHIRREDLLGQAISLVRAAQTDRYMSEQPEDRPARYRQHRITWAMLDLARGQARWEIWFARNGIQPLRMTYEELMADPQGAVTRIARLMGVENATIDLDEVSTGIMRDSMSEDWRRRYLAEAPSKDGFASLSDWSPLGIARAVRRAFR